MLKRFLFALALAIAFPAAAQFGVGGVGPLAPRTPDTVMPAAKIYVKLSTIPARRFSYSVDRYKIVCTGVYDSGTPACTSISSSTTVPNRYTTGLGVNNSGSFRVNCNFSHASNDDPIVWPGQSGRTHLHQFFGNANTRSSTDLTNMATSGNSTCGGGTLNRSGYWAPTLVFHDPTNASGTGRDGEVIVSDKANFYYKIATGYAADTSGYGGTAAQWAPAGLRMIAGDASSRVTQSGKGTGFVFTCFRGGAPQNPPFDHIPTTAEGTAKGGCDDIQFGVPFPECWDGTNLDSGATHNSHMAYADATLGCTTNVIRADTGATVSGSLYPKLFPSISLNIHHAIANSDLDYLRLSSDYSRSDSITNGCTSATNYCAGFTLHSDWVNGWNQTTTLSFGMTVTAAILKECYMISNPLPTQHSDCHDHLLGSPAAGGTYLGTDDWYSLF